MWLVWIVLILGLFILAGVIMIGIIEDLYKNGFRSLRNYQDEMDKWIHDKPRDAFVLLFVLLMLAYGLVIVAVKENKRVDLMAQEASYARAIEVKR